MHELISTQERAEGPRALSWLGDRHTSVLAHGEICRFSPLDVFQDILNGFFYPTGRIESPLRQPEPAESMLRAGRLNRMTVAFVQYGSAAVVDGGTLGHTT